jgi:hypothetical protein
VAGAVRSITARRSPTTLTLGIFSAKNESLISISV